MRIENGSAWGVRCLGGLMAPLLVVPLASTHYGWRCYGLVGADLVAIVTGFKEPALKLILMMTLNGLKLKFR